MSRINTNVNVMTAQRVTAMNTKSLNTSLERLSTGLRINRGKDDPAGLIASENLRSEKAAINSAISNAQRADQVVNVAEGGLQEINSALVELQSLVTGSANEAGLSKEEKEANQQQVESILQTIDRISNNTSFQGTKLLNGNFDFQVASKNSSIQSLEINAAKLGETALDVKANITQSAQQAGLYLCLGGGVVLDDKAESVFKIEVGGSLGSRQLSFASGASVADVVAQINTFSDVTGVVASAGAKGVMLKSSNFGSQEFVSVNVLEDSSQAGGIHAVCAVDADVVKTAGPTAFSAVTDAIRDKGQDLAGTINGIAARGDGKTMSVKSDALDLSVTLDKAKSQAAGSLDLLDITGGGAKFSIGPSVDATNQVRLGISSVSSGELGTTTFNSDTYSLSDLGGAGKLNLIDGDLEKAQDVVNAAIKSVSAQRGRLGSFQKNIIGSTVNSMNVALENISAAESAIRDTDFAKETAEMTRSQILSQASQTVLAQAKSQPTQVLSLLR